MKKDFKLELLAIGLDPNGIQNLRAVLGALNVPHHLSCVTDVREVEQLNRKEVDAVFFCSRLQVAKIIQDSRKILLALPQTALILISDSIAVKDLVEIYRIGIFDYLNIPLEIEEFRKVIYRLQMFEAIHAGNWTPERAVLSIFSRPDSFQTREDLITSLNQYLNLFLTIEAHVFYSSSSELFKDLRRYIKFSEHQLRRIERFIRDPSGVIFGIRFYDSECHFLIKTDPGKFSYLKTLNNSAFKISDIMSEYLSNILKTSQAILLQSRNREEAELLSLTDDVTGLFNQRKLHEDINFYINNFKLNHKGFSLLFVDIDFFKNVNDSFGHVIGSDLLIQLAGVLKSCLRAGDWIYRYGGDEFIILLPGSELEDTKKIAMRISQAVKNAEFTAGPSKQYKLSLSIGIANYPDDASTAKEIIDFADRMMYESKKSGRGKVFHVKEVV